MIVYLDSSVVLRRVLGQPHALTEWPRIQTAVAGALAEVECLRTIDRLRLRGLLTDAEVARHRSTIAEVIDRVELVLPSSLVLRRAAEPFPTSLGTLDAIHLATALLWRDERNADLVLATHDEELALAARACRLRVVGAPRG